MDSSKLHAKHDANPLRLPVWGVDSIFGSSCGLSETSSSDGFSTSFGSDLGSTETETESEYEGEEDFIAELTRQMADYMLQDEDNENTEDDEIPLQEFSPKFMLPCGCGYEGKWCNCNVGSICYYDNKELLESDSANQTSFMFNDTTRPIEVYKLTNQPSVTKRGRRAESTQQRKTGAESQLGHKDRRAARNGGGGGAKANPVENGSGMQAIFLGGSGYGYGNDSHSGGTGVFLPRGMNQHPTEPKKKSGCSTVLIPVRVLQALQLHFNQIESVSSQSNVSPPPNDGKTKDLHSEGQRRTTDTQFQPTKEMGTHELMQLPQEWTY